MKKIVAVTVLAMLTSNALMLAAPDRPLVAKPAFHVVGGERYKGQLIITDKDLKYLPLGGRGKEIYLMRDQIKSVESDRHKEGASVGSVIAFGLFARKRNFTTIGITTTDGEVFVFSIKGKETMEYVMAIRRLAEKEAE